MYGCHVGFCKTLVATFKLASKQGCTAFQFFLGSTRTYKRTQVTEHDLKQIQQYKMPMFIHSPYVFSLTHNFEKTKENLLHELKVSGKVKNSAVVIHAGSYASLNSLSDGVEAVVNNIKELYKNDKDLGVLLIENMAGQGKMMPNTLETIAEILKKVDNKKVGWCFDTCHGFASGMVDLRKIVEIDKFYDEIEKQVGIESLKVIHLNDSEKSYDSHKDLHANLKKGFIWKKHPEVLVYFIEKFKQIPMVAETTDWDYDKSVIEEIIKIKCDKETIKASLTKDKDSASILLKLFASHNIRFNSLDNPKQFIEEAIKKDKELKFLEDHIPEATRVLDQIFTSQKKIVYSSFNPIG